MIPSRASALRAATFVQRSGRHALSPAYRRHSGRRSRPVLVAIRACVLWQQPVVSDGGPPHHRSRGCAGCRCLRSGRSQRSPRRIVIAPPARGPLDPRRETAAEPTAPKPPDKSSSTSRPAARRSFRFRSPTWLNFHPFLLPARRSTLKTPPARSTSTTHFQRKTLPKTSLGRIHSVDPA